MLEIFVIGIIACAAGLTGFVYGLRHRKVIEKGVKDSYSAYLEELAQNGGDKHEYNPHTAFNKAFDDAATALAEKLKKDREDNEDLVYRNPSKNKL